MATPMIHLGLVDRARRLLDGSGRHHHKQKRNGRPNLGDPHAKHLNRGAQSHPKPIWMETEARVTECRDRLVPTGAPTQRFGTNPSASIVSFTYYAHARTYYDKRISLASSAKGDTFPVYYNALNPKQNTLSLTTLKKPRPPSAIALLGFVLVSLLLFAMASG